MRRASVEPAFLSQAIEGTPLILPSEASHRLINVLRLNEGSLVELFDGSGKAIQGELTLKPQPALVNWHWVEIGGTQTPIWVAQALVKMDKLEQIVQRGTELSATRFILFGAERSQISFGDKAPSKIERLTRIAQDASRQCERYDVPQIDLAASFSELLKLCDDFEGLVLYGDPAGEKPLLTMLQQGFERNGVLFIIGPEGGLSDREESDLRAHGAQSVCWARHTLRTETAGMAALAIIGACEK